MLEEEREGAWSGEDMSVWGVGRIRVGREWGGYEWMGSGEDTRGGCMEQGGVALAPPQECSQAGPEPLVLPVIFFRSLDPLEYCETDLYILIVCSIYILVL